MLGEGRLTARHATVDTDNPPLTATAHSVNAASHCLISTRPEINGTAGSGEPSGYRPPSRCLGFAIICVAARHVGQARPPETATRRQEGHRFKQIGLAGTIGPGQHYWPGIELKPGLGITAKIRQCQAPEGQGLRAGICRQPW
jgi:hypothetical protein